jgi:threonine aldolase
VGTRYLRRMPTLSHIDLRSDTVTRPTAAMRQAMASAEVGDDVLDGDPTARRLESRVAELLGKERALFFPSGTMANQTAIWLLARRGSDVLVDQDAHVLLWEYAGAAALCGVQCRALAPAPGRLVLDAATLDSAAGRLAGNATLLCLENTHNGAGGVVTGAAELAAMAAVARRHGLRVHLDGARLWNASAATDDPLDALAAPADTVMVSFTKGLGAPVGAVLAGSAEAMADARVARRRFGGGMRQSGVLAAAALHGLEHHRARLAEDHARARVLAERVEGAGGATVVGPDTNIVMIDLPAPAAERVAARAAERGVRVTVWSATRLRAVTHLDVDDPAVERAAGVLAEALEAERAPG